MDKANTHHQFGKWLFFRHMKDDTSMSQENIYRYTTFEQTVQYINKVCSRTLCRINNVHGDRIKIKKDYFIVSTCNIQF